MTEFLKVLLNIRSLRAALRELSFEQLQEANEKFSSIYNERVAEIEKTRAADAERLAKLAEFQAMLADAGIDPTELVQGVPAGKAQRDGTKRAPRPPKYRYMAMVKSAPGPARDALLKRWPPCWSKAGSWKNS